MPTGRCLCGTVRDEVTSDLGPIVQIPVPAVRSG
jgi:hypothetical protein